MRILILAAAIALSACGQQPVYRTVETPFTVQSIDLERYLGLWHEQARLPNQFEQGCARATAQYGLRDDGLVCVLNTCFEAGGESRDAKGRARWAGAEGEGKLEVSFFGPFWADYWVVERANDYSWSIVSEPGGRYLWILTRAERLTAQERAILTRACARSAFAPAIWFGPITVRDRSPWRRLGLDRPRLVLRRRCRLVDRIAQERKARPRRHAEQVHKHDQDRERRRKLKPANTTVAD